jgi:4-carboxymuconolactone decarboxylase
MPSLRHIIRASTPGAHDAMRRVRAVTDTDRALDAGLKALLMAAACAAQQDATSAARELGRCRELGVLPARVWAVAALVLSSRGEGAYAEFVGGALPHFDPPPGDPDSVPLLPEGGDVEAAEAYLSARTGSLPGYALLLRDMAPEAFVGYARLLETTWGQPELSPRDVQLILVCINVATIRPEFAAHHSRLARDAGATDEEIIEAGICGIPCGGVTAWYGTGGELL